ncbi:MAG: leucyl/phenylalanyl-tRNA--protein transferase [Sandaracinaceae bacterium]|nr:MAG: leucyl/phenylalanyl-tRNA--protein transferase [Sandaracinaceae bacterium]HBQ14038.1 leucyl/phenylalanyl-tRNA--protein transferase [Myxococcales bacterium]
MPVYLLTDELLFPPPEGASPEGVVAIGGDFAPERLLLAYGQGIFPWPTEGFPLLWFSPDPRFVLRPTETRINRTLRKQLARSPYRITADTAFDEVIRACADVPRPGQSGTWITDDLIDGYDELHARGFAHSVEAWEDDTLVGGVYGVSLGGVFFGESMFAASPDASKIAFVTLMGNLAEWDFDLVDCQVHTDHLERFGACRVKRASFLARLHESLEKPTRRGPWRLPLGPAEALERLQRS